MGFAGMTNLWTLVFPLTVIIYYLFRKRFEPKMISSTLFWNEDRREENVSPFIRNLQRNALFYLQLLALLVFVWMMLEPFTKHSGTEGIPLVFIVDSSATMLATPKDSTLFEMNQAEMEKLLESAEGRPISVVITGKEPEFAIQNSDSHAAIQVIEDLTVRYEQNHMETSIELVKSMYSEHGAEVHIFTDSLERTALSYDGTNMSWHVHTNDEKLNNHSIVRFGANRLEDSVTAIVKLHHDTEKAQPGTIRLKEADTRNVLAEKSFDGEPGSEELVSFKKIETNAPALLVELDGNDDYLADNTSYALLATERAKVVVDAELHELLKKAAQAIEEVTIDSGEDFEEGDILRITGSESFLDQGNRPIFLVGRNDVKPIEAKGEVSVTNDPLFSIAAPKDMYVEEVYPSYEDYEVLARIGKDPLIQRSPRGDIIFLADLEATDWPLQPTFPLFVWSVMKSLSDDAETLGIFTPLQRKSVVMTEAADIYELSGSYLYSAESANTLQAPAIPGIYKVTEGTTDKLFAVQLDASERILRIGDSYSTGNLTATDRDTEQIIPVIWPFLVPLLLLLLVEWEVQRRRGYPY
ncbi:vWA domain-containing protein [Sporosarcina gallistercoris]|uniref:BatA domain-containing protein n=1 Tax=Sporosarcina gallistercoris TaxID=2762245 RepID=A0ABR8PGI3_9BACL|nr:BatA and WFA domain-containing protein [Sporosarcina gallistercoris]MBD7907282.1 BatA domain-containing protein [Sporosarcina gallistercoris]